MRSSPNRKSSRSTKVGWMTGTHGVAHLREDYHRRLVVPGADHPKWKEGKGLKMIKRIWEVVQLACPQTRRNMTRRKAIWRRKRRKRRTVKETGRSTTATAISLRMTV